MHQRSDALLLVLQSLSRESCSSAQLFCFLLTIQNVTHWWRIDAKLMGNEKDVKQRTKNQQTFQTQSRFASQIRFHRRSWRSFENGKIVNFSFKLSISSFGSVMLKPHQDAWKFFWSQSREKTMGVHVIKVAINELMWWALTFGVTY